MIEPEWCDECARPADECVCVHPDDVSESSDLFVQLIKACEAILAEGGRGA